MIDKYKEYYSKLSSKKIEINWNKNPIEMKLFLSFLTVEYIKNNDHLGSSSGWTLYKNEKLNLLISGGIINGIEYLNDLRFGHRLDNPYNNYVNPFYLFNILNNKGKIFFVKYYEEDIFKIIDNQEKIINDLELKIKGANKDLQNLKDFYQQLNYIKE